MVIGQVYEAGPAILLPMVCYCGCGTKVPRKLTDLNLRLGEMAFELLAWDKYRTTGARDPAQTLEIEGLIDRGAACFRRMLATIHGERDDASLRESDAWLEESRAAWSKRPEMTEKGSLLWGKKLRLTDDDLARLDRLRPGESFSAAAPTGPGRDRDGDLAGQLERLGALHGEGVLTDEEFRAAKARLLG
jgi:hypothetical protein